MGDRNCEDEYAKLWQMYGDLEDQRDRLREAVNTALLHMNGYVHPTAGQECLKRVLRDALQDAEE